MLIHVVGIHDHETGLKIVSVLFIANDSANNGIPCTEWMLKEQKKIMRKAEIFC